MHLRFIALLIILILFAAPCLAEPLNVAISPLAAEDSPEGLATEYLKKLIEERSSGRLLVTIETNNTNHGHVLEALSKQTIQFALLNIRDLRQTLPMLQLCELPFLFRDRQHLHRSLDDETGSQILQASQKHQLTPLAVWDGASRQILAAEALPSPGEIPVQLISGRLSDTVVTTQNGTAWKEITLSKVSRSKAQQGLDTLTLTNHSFSGSALVVQQEFWHLLPKDLKVIINGAVKDATIYVRELAEQKDSHTLNEINNDEIIVTYSLSPEQREFWQKRIHDLYSQVLDKVELEIAGKIIRNQNGRTSQ